MVSYPFFWDGAVPNLNLSGTNDGIRLIQTRNFANDFLISLPFNFSHGHSSLCVPSALVIQKKQSGLGGESSL